MITDHFNPPLTPEQQAIVDAVPLRRPGRFGLSASQMAAGMRLGAKLGVSMEDLCRSLSAATTSTVSTTPPSALDLAEIEKLLESIPPEPIGEWMREQGFPPEKSLLILPETMRDQLPFWPSYVRFSLNVDAPTLCRDLMALPIAQEYGQRYRK